ncbi:integrase repeat-containing protein [Photobacterium sp. GB-72]|uniref:integrase repeat-containing protein n=1 Tax=Photobacterium sp. GB-72 TaxID=2022105 RepID=UPI000D178535|nr:integrase repeat-containing protein [Photobacterium sp. GB-72]PSV28050.1 hypothetical protein C9J40_19415 [Photobacterium sp. GB-72]
MKLYSYKEAQSAVKKIGIKSRYQYRTKYRFDERLPLHPDKVYLGSGWVSWDEFTGGRYYRTYKEAKAAALKLKVTSRVEYLAIYKSDPLLPSAPQNIYPNEFSSWSNFLDIEIQTYYTYHEAKAVLKNANVKTSSQYVVYASTDPRLHSKPQNYYKDEWVSWSHFLTDNKSKFYTNFSKARVAARKLVSRNELTGGRYYRTYKEAKAAALKLKVTSRVEYLGVYKSDPLLPSAPQNIYPNEFSSWSNFLDIEIPTFYTYHEARDVLRNANLTTSSQYVVYASTDPRLHSKPQYYYKDEWVSWSHFLTDNKSKFYTNFSKARVAARKLGCQSIRDYKQKYKNDPFLHSNPAKYYRDQWQGWEDFLLLSLNKLKRYTTLSEAREAARKLHCKSSADYIKRYQYDPLLPSNPKAIFSQDWLGWKDYLGIEDKYYPTLALASKAARTLRCGSKADYKRRCKLDPMLHFYPDNYYKEQWSSWYDFLGTKEKEFYPTLAEASEAARELRCISVADYQKRRKIDPLLPFDPSKMYSEEWLNWKDYLGLESKFYPTLAEASKAARALRFTSVIDYRKRRKTDPLLPSDPQRCYREDWLNWKDFLGN